MSFDPKALSPEDREALLRWRLALGKGAETTEPGLGLDGLGADGAAADLLGLDVDRVSDFDKALGFVYSGGGERGADLSASRPYIPTWLANLREFFKDDVVALVQKDAIERKGLTELLFEPETLPLLDKNLGSTGSISWGSMSSVSDFVTSGGGERGADLSASRPYIPTWLANLREFFKDDVVALVQKDAIERKGLTELLFEPETLPLLDKNVELVTTLISARGLIPDKAKEIARQIVREVVEELRKKLTSRVRSAVLGAIRKDRTSPLRVMRNIDWKRTIRQNLKGWDSENKRLVPERFYFWGNQKRRNEWDVAILVDQSGSMAESVVYSSVMAAIFASLDVLKTKLLFFDTEVVDMTPVLDDPVEVLFSTQLGGGTDINRAVAYGQRHFVEKPEKTLFILITDLYEGGNEKELVARLRELVDSRVKVLCLLALSDGGHPYFDHALAGRVRALGIPCFGCSPGLLVQVVERIMKNQELGSLVESAGQKRP